MLLPLISLYASNVSFILCFFHHFHFILLPPLPLNASSIFCILHFFYDHFHFLLLPSTKFLAPIGLVTSHTVGLIGGIDTDKEYNRLHAGGSALAPCPTGHIVQGCLLGVAVPVI